MNNPYEPPSESPEVPPQKTELSGTDTYNIISDTVTGMNIRMSDNIFQAVVIFIGTVLGVAIGALIARFAIEGFILGGMLGMIAGLFGSGIYLMIYRMVQHSRCKHD